MVTADHKEDTRTAHSSKETKDQKEINAFGKSLRRQLLIDKIIVIALLGFAIWLSIYIGRTLF